MRTRHGHRHGFSIAELAILTMVLAALAATVMPGMTAADSEAKTSTLRQNWKVLQTAIDLYHHQHRERYPAQDSRDPRAFERALLLSSDEDGVVGAVGTKPRGPYLIGQIPANPHTGGRGVKIVHDLAVARPDGNPKIGWLYDPETGRIAPNSADGAM